MADLHRRIYCLEGQIENSFVYHVKDGLYYHLSWHKEDVMYLKCIHYGSLNCPGRAIINERGFRHTKGHENHRPDMLLEEEKMLRTAVLDRCRSLDLASFKDILLQERTRFQRAVQVRVPYVKIRGSMLRARRSQYPETPASIEELTAILQNPQYEVISQTLDGEDNLFAGSTQTPDGHTHILFGTQRMLRILRRCQYVFSDGTFKAVPSLQSLDNRRSQIFSIVVSWRGHTLPICWAVMENRTQQSYEAVLHLISNLLGGLVNIQVVVTDDEVAQHQAWQEVFDVSLQDCLWHMCRRFINKITALHLGRWFHEPLLPQFVTIVRMACALPLLPSHHMALGWRLLRRESRRQGGDILRNLLRPFFEYLWTEFVGNPHKRERMSVFNSWHRTNNCSESSNRTLNNKVGPHPGIYEFINGLVELEDQAYSDFVTLDLGYEASRARRTSAVRNDATLRRLSAELQAAPFGIQDAVLRFLRVASHRIENMFYDLAGIQVEPANEV